MMQYAAALVASLALLFTVFSFWWLNARKGEVICYEPTTYLAHVQMAPDLALRLPLVFYNSGPRDRVLRELRCVLEQPGGATVMPWASFRDTIRGTTDDMADMAGPTPIRGRTAILHNVQFYGPMRGGMLEALDYELRVVAKLDDSPGWTPLLSFPWRAWHMTAIEAVVRANSMEQCYEDERERSAEFFRSRRPKPPLPNPLIGDTSDQPHEHT